ncbi:MAG: CatB-related O-acetyltransferase [Cyclobacteriaceae bacterium]|nr:CatB-related O-acetyltransferase [Cyclobacteriaceae bacterium]
MIEKIPVVRFLNRLWKERKFQHDWRKRNSHNETKVAGRQFSNEVVEVGKGTYGTIQVQSLYVTPNEKLVIGNYVSIAPDVVFLLGVNHPTDTLTTFPFYTKLIQRSSIDALSKGPIFVDDEVWIGTGAKIFSGVTIGKGAIVAAGALVTKNVEPYAIVGGNPARLIRYRFSPEIVKILMPIRMSNFSSEWIKENIQSIYQKIESEADALQLKALFDSYPNTKV